MLQSPVSGWVMESPVHVHRSLTDLLLGMRWEGEGMGVLQGLEPRYWGSPTGKPVTYLFLQSVQEWCVYLIILKDHIAGG